jgi:hypothetical protein
MSIAALVLGILSVALNIAIGWIPIVGQIICIALGVLAIIFAALAMKKEPEKKGFNIAGLVLGIVGASWGLIGLIACVACIGIGAAGAAAAANELQNLDFGSIEEGSGSP